MGDPPHAGYCPAPLPPDEAERLAALRRYAVLDTPPEPGFDRIARLAARLFRVPIVLVTFVDERRQWCKACVGIGIAETPREEAFCAYTILADEVLHVADALGDPRFAGNPLVTGDPNIRFYAGAPLTTTEGQRIGALCLIDRVPREDFSAEDATSLRELASLASDELELRRAHAEDAARMADFVRAGEELRHHAALLDGIINGVPEPLYVKDRQNRFVFVNDAAVRLIGQHREDIIGRRFSEVVAAPGVEEMEAASQQVIDSGVARQSEESAVLAGAQRTFLSTKVPWRDAEGRSRGLIGISRDITDRKRAEQALRESEALHRLLTEHSSDMIVRLGGDRRRRYVSPASRRLLGLEPEELLGIDASALVHPDDLACFLDIFDRTYAGGSPGGNLVYRLRHRDGRWIWIETNLTPYLNETTGEREVVSVVRDVTERKEREASFHLLFESNPVPLWVYDRDSLRILEANDSALAQYGYARGDFLRMTMNDIRPAQEVTMLRAALLADEPPNGRYGIWRHLRADGRIIEVDIASRRFTYRGRPAALVAAIDVSAQRGAEAALRAAKEEAEAASRTKTEFLANVSHELRTPLNAIIGFSEVIQNALMGPVDARYRDYAQDINSSGQHLLQLINDVLDFSKIEVGRLELGEEACRLTDIITPCARLVAERAKVGGVTLAIELPENLPRIHADPLRLKQIVLNLLSNAVKFTPAGGRVTVSVAVDDAVSIIVADTGIGMERDEIPIALAPFRQVDGAMNRRFEGTGLGLPLARTLTELHGGTLAIESEPGRGTIVRIELPGERILRHVA